MAGCINLKTSSHYNCRENTTIRQHLKAFSIVLIIVGSDGQFKFSLFYRKKMHVSRSAKWVEFVQQIKLAYIHAI